VLLTSFNAFSTSRGELLDCTEGERQSFGLVLLATCQAFGHNHLRIVHTKEGQHSAQMTFSVVCGNAAVSGP